MKSILVITSMLSFFIALMIFFQSMQNAFKKSFKWGMIIILLFPIGSFWYYKNFIEEEKKSAINYTISLLVGTATILIANVM